MVRWCASRRSRSTASLSSTRHTSRARIASSSGGGENFGWYTAPVAASAQRPSRNSAASASGRSSTMTASGVSPRETIISACAGVRGKPSSIQPFVVASRSLRRAATTSETSSHGSSSPRAIISDAASPSGVRARCCARSSAPTPTFATRYETESIAPIVPLPDAGLPSSTTFSGAPPPRRARARMCASATRRRVGASA